MQVLEATHQQQAVTVDDFERLLEHPENRDRLLELIHGEVVEKMPAEEHGLIAGNLVFALSAYNRQHKLGRVGVEVRHRLPDDRHNSRMPDVSFSSARRPLVTEGGVPEMADLAVEIKSPGDTVRQLRDKAAYYLEQGARMVWLVYPSQRIVEVYTPDEDVLILVEGDQLTGGEVLPGFSLPVADVFIDPVETP
ncbi:MAG: Uma2 family endonuclease [Caldilineaceae bacterium]|nr:Uma2 family endonuclease [Caldilineaceae bacterium]